MPFPDPAAANGSREERLAQVRAIRDMIKTWLMSPGPDDFSRKSGLTV
jgi:hypothetical protein